MRTFLIAFIFLDSFSAFAQTAKWLTVTEDDFLGRNISKDQIQYIDGCNDFIPPSDDTKIGRLYSDRSGRMFYWINLRPQSIASAKSEAKTDHEFANLKIYLPYVVDAKDKKKYEIWEKIKGGKLNPFHSAYQKYGNAMIISQGSKEVAIFGKTRDLYSLLWDFHASYRGVDYPADYVINDILKTLRFRGSTKEEKINFLKKLLVDDPQELIATLPAYDPPRVDISKLKNSSSHYHDEERIIRLKQTDIDRVLGP